MDMRESEMGLEEFGEFLLRRRIVPEKNAKFYVSWVRKFLGQAADPKLSLEERIEDFVEGLRRDGGREEWQGEQAERAVKTFFHAFRNGEGLEERPAARVERDAAVKFRYGLRERGKPARGSISMPIFNIQWPRAGRLAG